MEEIAITLTAALAYSTPAEVQMGTGLLAEFQQPPSARIQLYDEGDTISFLVPAVGMKSKAGALFATGLAYDALLLLVCVCLAVSGWDALGDTSIFKLIKVGFYFGLGLVWTVVGFHYARRRAAIVLTAEEMVYRAISPLRTQEFHWKRSDIKSITVVKCASARNQVSYQLEAELFSLAKKQVLLNGREFAELKWLTDIITHKWLPKIGEDNPM